MKLLSQERLLIDVNIKALADKCGIIENFDEKLLSGCSYDLRIGPTVRSRNRLETYNITNDSYIVESGECITIESWESVNFKNVLLCGIIANKHSILAKGLFHPITIIDPGFVGKLAITLVNVGNVRYELRYQDKIAKLLIMSIHSRPSNIYGVTQVPSYREGSTDIALIIDKPRQRDDYTELKLMYGKPLSVLYDRIEEIERKYETQWMTNQYHKAQERKKAVVSFIVAVVAAAMVSITTLYWQDIMNLIKALWTKSI